MDGSNEQNISCGQVPCQRHHHQKDFQPARCATHLCLVTLLLPHLHRVWEPTPRSQQELRSAARTEWFVTRCPTLGSLALYLHNFPHMSLTGPRKNSYENTWQRGDEAMSRGGSQRINSSQTLSLSADMTGKENAPSSSSTREYKTIKEEHD